MAQMLKFIHNYALQRGISYRDALQTFMQYVVLKHLNHTSSCLMGGTALVLGYGNPRFSEDIDLTCVPDPKLLKTGLVRAVTELSQWFKTNLELVAPKNKQSTWRIKYALNRATTITLHVDTQSYESLTKKTFVMTYYEQPPVIFSTLELGELMADKVIAFANRPYICGRDVFDLWFHWLQKGTLSLDSTQIKNFIKQKLIQRKILQDDFKLKLTNKIDSLKLEKRVLAEFDRYLLPQFQNKDLYKEIISSCQHMSLFY